MCDCPEMQDGWEPVSRDLVNSKDSNLIYTCAYKHLDLYKFYTPDSSASYTSVSLRNLRIKFIWLPRQDQLQRKDRGENDPHCGAMFCRFTDWLNETKAAAPEPEQLWLAFVMHELHNKKWAGDQWKR